MTRHLRVAGLLLQAALVGTACAQSSTPSSPSPTATAIAIHGLSATTEAGLAVQVTASVTLSDGVEKVLAAEQVTWRTSDTRIATVSTTGLLTVVAPGEVDLIATFQTISATAHLIAVLPAPPTAVLSIVVVGQEGQQSPLAIPGLSQVRFDLSRSTGSGLQYQVDFGDGSVSSGEQVATYEYSSEFARKREARVTVVVTDRFGRTASNKSSIGFISLQTPLQCFCQWMDRGGWVIRFETHQGRSVAGDYLGVRFTGQLSGDRNIDLVFENGTRLSGLVVLDEYTYPRAIGADAHWSVRGGIYSDRRLRFTVHGGQNDGQVKEFFYYEVY